MLADLRQTTNDANAVIRADSPLIIALEKALGDAATTAKSVQGLAEMHERQPDALLKGRGKRKENR